MDDTRTRASEKLAAMHIDQRESYLASWRSVDAHFRQAAAKGAKVFEVHHAVEKARERFFAAIVEGKSPAECEIEAVYA